MLTPATEASTRGDPRDLNATLLFSSGSGPPAPALPTLATFLREEEMESDQPSVLVPLPRPCPRKLRLKAKIQLGQEAMARAFRPPSHAGLGVLERAADAAAGRRKPGPWMSQFPLQ